MKNITKEKNKRRRLKVVFVITSVCVIFSLFCISCFAYQTGVVYSPNVFSGTNSYLYHPIERISYLTRSGNNYYLKDIPVSDSYTVYKSNGWVNHGEPLKMNATSQTTYTNEVYTGIVNPLSITSAYDYDIRNLGTDYSNYFNGGIVDAVRYQIFCNQAYATASSSYQRAIIDFADIYIPNPRLNETLADVADAQLRIYRPVAYGGAISSIRCTVSGRSTLDGKIVSQDIAVNDRVDNEIEATVDIGGAKYNIYSFGVFHFIDSQLDDVFDECNYWYITNLTCVLGRQSYNPEMLAVDPTGCFACDLYFPSVRPFDANKIDTTDKAFNVTSPVNYDVNYIRNYYGSRDLAGDDSSDLEISSVGHFISQITRGFLDIYIIPGISLGGILFTCLAIGFIVVVLRYFAGG